MKKIAIIICRCLGDGYADIPFDGVKALLDGYDADVFLVQDLCAAVFTHKAKLEEINRTYKSRIIFACHPRAIKNLFIQQKIDFEPSTVINYRSLDADGIQKNIDSLKIDRGPVTFTNIQSTLNKPAWFPIIDIERCVSCGSCASFCVFGVYRMENKKLIVQQPLNCKNNCPACARTCPEAAIIFPKIDEDGAICGSSDVLPESNTVQGPGLKAIRSSVIKKAVMEKAQAAYDEAKKSFHDGSVKKK